MRRMGLLLLSLMIACKSGESAAPAPDPAALKAQQELLSKRDALLAQRQKLKEQKEKLEGDLKVAQTSHTDTVEIQKQLDSINVAIDSSAQEASAVASKIDSALASGDKASQLAVREASLNARENAITAREKDQDRKLAQEIAALREVVNAKCGGETIVQQITAPPLPVGHGTSKKDVDDRLKHARDAMYKHGILTSDLPGPAQGLEGEATHAMAENEMSKAYALANQLALQVDAMRIDSAFIRAKIARLQAQLKASKVDDATQAQLADTLTNVMNDFGNGKFDLANQRLNALASKLK